MYAFTRLWWQFHRHFPLCGKTQKWRNSLLSSIELRVQNCRKVRIIIFPRFLYRVLPAARSRLSTRKPIGVQTASINSIKNRLVSWATVFLKLDDLITSLQSTCIGQFVTVCNKQKVWDDGQVSDKDGGICWQLGICEIWLHRNFPSTS